MLLNTKTDVKRSGMILLIVVAFLSMFLVVGTTYLLVADSIRRTSDFDLNATDKRSDFALMPDIDPRYMLNFALGQIIYDVVDPTAFDQTTGKLLTTNSALRGHSLATNMYGVYEPQPITKATATATVNGGQISSIPVAFGGSGYTVPPRIIIEGGGGSGAAAFAILNSTGQVSAINIISQGSNYNSPPNIYIGVPNDRPFNGGGKNPDPVTGELNYANYKVFGLTTNGAGVRDPEKGFRGTPAYTRWNPPYTFPDKNHLYLGSYTLQSDGIIALTPSFHRQDLFGPMDTNSIPSVSPPPPEVLNPGNPNWLPPAWGARTADNSFVIDLNRRHRTLRPRPFDQLTGAELDYFSGTSTNLPSTLSFLTQLEKIYFNSRSAVNPLDKKFITAFNNMISNNQIFPYPEADGGDVKNLEGYPGGNDSIWIDAGFPVMTTPDGRKYKALIAPLILDLDGRINLNVAGNLMQRNAADVTIAKHASNQGWGRWEINPQGLIDAKLGRPVIDNNNPNGVISIPVVLKGGYYDSAPTIQISGGGGTGATATAILVNKSLDSIQITNNGMDYTTPPDVQIIRNEVNEFLNHLSFSIANNFPASLQSGSQINQWKTYGRLFQANYLPINSNPPTVTNFFNTSPHSYAQVDFNGAGDFGAWGSTTRPTFVNANGFPTFGQGFGNGLASEHLLDGVTPSSNYHARNYNANRTQKNPTNPIPTDPNLIGVSTVFPVSETASILRWQGRGEPFSKSQLAQLLPKSLGLDMPYASPNGNANPDALFRQRIRNMVTTLSADLDRPAMVPIDLDPNYKVVGNNSPNDYPLRSVDTVVSTPNITTPPLKLDLNRALRSFPPYTSTSGLFYDKSAPSWTNTETAIKYAIDDRKAFAGAIFNYLKNITGFTGSDNAILIVQQTNRWLAQLSVNIVDFIDNDDFSTAWEWATGQWVFGVEMPRLVINELYVQCQNNKNDMLANDTATKDYDINTFIELYNPLVADATYGTNPGTHKAVLQYAIDPTDPTNVASNYKVVIAKRGKTTDPAMFSDNVAAKITEIDTNSVPNKVNYHGAFDFTSPMATPPTLPLSMAEVTTWQDGDQIVDVDTCKLLRDSADLRTLATPAFNGAFNFKNASLNMTVPLANTPGLNDSPAVFLQRLVMPGLPFENDSSKPLYNPYITTDSFTARNMHDYRERDKDKIQGAMIINPIVKSASRLTPFLDSTGNSFYNGANAQPAQTPTFGNKNNNGIKPWFTFLDRQLINPLELIHVPCCKPHELTQMATRWNDPVGQAYRYAHNWPWFDENTRLYRFIEAVGVSPLQAGEAMHGRALGKVNVNTMNGVEVFQSVADDAPANNFTAAEVKTAYENLVGIIGNPNKPDQRPILSFGQANYTDGMGIKTGLNKSLMGYSDPSKPYENFLDNTILDPTDNTNRYPKYPATWFTPNPMVAGDVPHPPATYARKELLTKIGNTVTTKSNVFAVWITTGYFEVRDDSTQPPKLGAEIGKADGINIRHRMFAIVDRTNMTNFETTYPNAITITPPATSITVPYAGAVTGTNPNTKANWSIQAAVAPNLPVTQGSAGTILVFEPNTDFEETVEVQVGGNVTFTKNHPAGCKVINRGNPGPWVGYDRTKDRDVVPYAEIIE